MNFSAAEKVKIPAEKVEAFTVDPATGNRTDLVFNRRSHRWEVPISSLERAINPLAVNMPDSFFVKDPTTGSIYPVRYEPYHEYVWARDDKSKNPSIEFIADYYLPGEYAPPGGWHYHGARAGGVIDRDKPYNRYGNPLYRYKGSSGMKYKYDLSNPSDRLKYELDLGAQMKDEINPDPRIQIDRGFGQYGGGAK